MAPRNRMTSGAVAALLIALVLLGWQAIRATQAVSAARDEARKSGQVVGFLQNIIRESAPSVLKGREANLLYELIDQTAKRIPAELEDPNVQSDLYVTLGWEYYRLSGYASAESMFGAAVGIARKRQADPIDLADKLNQLGIAILDGGEPVRAEPLLNEALGLVSTIPTTARAKRHDIMRVLASAQEKRGHIVEAAATGRDLLASQREQLGRDHLDTARTLAIFGPYERRAGNLALSEAMSREALEIYRKRLGSEPRLIIEPLLDVASCLVDHGVLAQAELLLGEVETLLQREKERTSSAVWTSVGRLARVWAAHGDLIRAENLAREQLAFVEQEFSPNHPFVGQAHLILAMVLQKAGTHHAAETECRKALAIFEHTFGRKGRHAPSALEQLARILKDRGRYDEAETLCRDALAARQATSGERNALVLDSLRALAEIQTARGDHATAIVTLHETIGICRQHLGTGHPLLTHSLVALAENLLRQKGFDEAESTLAESWRVEEALGYTRIEPQRELHRGYVQLYRAWADSSSAKGALAVDWQKKLDALEAGILSTAARKL